MLSVAIAAVVGVAASATCDATGDAKALRERAAQLFAAGDLAAADACLAAALASLTSHLESLATEAQGMRSFREARQRLPAVAPGAHGCIVDANGASVCLPELSSLSPRAEEQPRSVEECASEEAALTLLSAQYDASKQLESAAPADDAAAASLDAAIVLTAQRHWWSAAKRALDVLRDQNVPPSAEARRVVTELRDGAGSLLALMRQTKMDEATISCAVMWAQGTRSIHLNVKFASRLDAPVTVLNVDNEVVSISENRVSFSGVGRQKPKRYVVDLELFAAIDANASSWSFGSVGTIRFHLRKLEEGSWARLTKSADPVKNHRVWWEKQEQVEAEDKEVRKKENLARLDEQRKVREAEEAEKEAKAAEEREKERAERAERRAIQKPLLDAALAAVDELASVKLATVSLQSSAEQLRAPKERVIESASALLAHESIGQGDNETAAATAEQLASSVVKLRSTGYADLTKDALTSAVAQLKLFLERHVEPYEEPPSKKSGKKKTKKKATKKKEAAAS